MTKTAFERVQTARHPERPYTLDLLNVIFEDFIEIHGDRRFADDPALVSGFAKIEGIEIAVVGQQKGRDINERRYRNFAMTKPEGYRKALRVMSLAEKFGRPIVTIIDTPGAYPGIDAEERGQAEAIAFNLREMANLKVPIVVVVLGEGGSGGALAIGVGDRVLMLENAVYSVITPEGCAAILWKDAGQAAKAAEGLRLTAAELASFGLIDEVIQESDLWTFGSESVENQKVFSVLKKSILKHLKELMRLPTKKLLNERYEKFRRMGKFED
ncbi:MAG TPA: acetyl-CoA carboxylase carboxyltransferase subunit alpha [Pyrinomonadaceae bacterium]|nr:acetyl-CoA carboxylase carboxyltransferase subunit alpha [Pyrinomonadaceae bacterium]